MENPNGRPVAVNLIMRTIDIWAEDMSNGYIGVSRETAVYMALKNAGYLTEAAMVPDEN